MNFVGRSVANRSLVILLHCHLVAMETAAVVLLITGWLVHQARWHTVLHLLRHFPRSLLIQLKGIVVAKVDLLPLVLHFVILLI